MYERWHVNHEASKGDPISQRLLNESEISEIAFQSAREVVGEKFPDELPLFDWARAVIEADLLPRMGDSHPRDWDINKLPTVKSLAAGGGVNMIPASLRISMVAQATFRHIAALDYVPRREEVVSITKEYATKWSLVEEVLGSLEGVVLRNLEHPHRHAIGTQETGWVEATLRRLEEVEPIPPQIPKYNVYLLGQAYPLSENHVVFVRSNPGMFHLFIDHEPEARAVYLRGKIQRFQPGRESADALWSRPYFLLYVLAKNHGQPMTRNRIASEAGALIKRGTAEPDIMFDQTLRQLQKTTKGQLKLLHQLAGYSIARNLPIAVLERTKTSSKSPMGD